MTIREYTEKYEVFETLTNHYDDEVVDSWEINSNVGNFLSPEEAKRYEYLAEKTDGWLLRLEKSNWEEDYRVIGNESAYERYFNEDTTMIEVYRYLLKSMEEDFQKYGKSF